MSVYIHVVYMCLTVHVSSVYTVCIHVCIVYIHVWCMFPYTCVYCVRLSAHTSSVSVHVHVVYMCITVHVSSMYTVCTCVWCVSLQMWVWVSIYMCIYVSLHVCDVVYVCKCEYVYFRCTFSFRLRPFWRQLLKMTKG